MRKIRFLLVLLLLLMICPRAIRGQAAAGDELATFSQGTESSKEGGVITWKFSSVDSGDGNSLGRFSVILSGTGSTLDYAPEYCASFNWTPEAPWTMTDQGANASWAIVKPGVTAIGAYCFYGMRLLGTVNLPEGLTSIGDYALANCATLSKVYIPDSVSDISSNAFYNSKMTIYCNQNSYAHKYAVEKGLKFNLMDVCNHTSYNWKVNAEATCTAAGTRVKVCANCGETLATETIAALGHSWGQWSVVSAATTASPEKQQRQCTRCGQTESRTVGSKLPEVTVSPQKVTSVKLTGATTLLAGKTTTLKVSVSPSNAVNQKVTWSTSNKKYATVSSKGVVTAKAAGAGKTVTITAKAQDGSGKKASLKIKIKGAVTKIKLTAPKTVKAGKKTTIKAAVTVGKGGSKALTWTSSNKKYATVTSKGVLQTKKAGKGKTVTITAKAKDGSGKKASVKIKIK